MNEFLLHNPGIIEPDKLEWDYEDDQQSHDGSYSPIDHTKTMTTPQTSPLDLSTYKRSTITVPSTPMNTPRRGTVNIREANWRQGRSNIQSASEIFKRDVIDWRRVKLPPGTKLPTHVYGEIPPYPCKYCNMRHIGMICPCTCGWIHLTKECPEVPYQPPKEEKPEYSVGPCWSCGQQGNFARTCPNVEISAKKEIPNFSPHYKEVQGSYEEETIPYHVEITKPQMIDGHLYRPGSGMLKDKTKTGPRQAYLPTKPSKSTPRREQASDKRDAQRSATSPPSDKPQGYTEGSGEGAPGERPPGKGPPDGNGDDGDDHHYEDDNDDEDNSDSFEELLREEEKFLDKCNGV